MKDIKLKDECEHVFTKYQKDRYGNSFKTCVICNLKVEAIAINIQRELKKLKTKN